MGAVLQNTDKEEEGTLAHSLSIPCPWQQVACVIDIIYLTVTV